VPEEHPENLETQASAFDQMLVEASEPELQEVIDQAPQLFRTQPLAHLLKCKALVDGRLAAEPEENAISMSDPHQIRLLQWEKIADRLGAEINFRASTAAPKPSGGIASSSVRRGAARDPMVAARRTIVRNHAGIEDKDLVKF
jgi:hypothetical protein